MTVFQPDNADQIAYWNGDVGDRWARLQRTIDGVFQPLTQVALDFAVPGTGSSVVDIGCGTGATVLALARAVGPSGRVLGVDVSEPMLAIARERVAAEKLTNASLRLADAATYRFPSPDADLVFSRFGVMFFADPVAAFANIRTALHPGGRLAFACWQPLAANPWFSVPLNALQTLLPPAQPSDPFAPGPLALADADRTHRLLDGAGFQHVEITPHDTEIRLGDRGQALDFIRQVGPAARALGSAEPEQRPALLEVLADTLARHDGPNGVVLGGAIWLVSARA